MIQPGRQDALAWQINKLGWWGKISHLPSQAIAFWAERVRCVHVLVPGVRAIVNVNHCQVWWWWSLMPFRPCGLAGNPMHRSIDVAFHGPWVLLTVVLDVYFQHMRRPDTSDDRHVMAKHQNIYPNESEVRPSEPLLVDQARGGATPRKAHTLADRPLPLCDPSFV